MRRILLVAATLLIAASAHADRPNILLIAIDDLNDWVGCLGAHPNARTPHIDRLAARGTLFTNAHCQGPICGPSRASLLSGLYPHTTGVYAQPNKRGLPEDRVRFRGHLLPEYFARYGYATLGCGKITHGYPISTAFQQTGPGGSSGPKPAEGKRFHYHLPDVPWTGTQTDWGVFPDRDAEMPDHQAADWAIDQLGRDHDGPFLLAVGCVRPHVPFYVPQKWFDLFPLDQVELPPTRIDDLDDVPAISRHIHEMPKYPRLGWLLENDAAQLRLSTQAYLACTAFVDHQVGRLLDALDASDHADNTIVILFSDHGHHLGEKDRICKHSLWEESTRVPLVVVRPGERRAAQAAQPVELIDIYPTLVELCGLPPRPTNEGRSLLPLLDDPRGDWRFAALTTYARNNHALRSERYRFIRYQDGSEELYDHADDPHEWHNLAGDPAHAELLARFRAELPRTNAPYHPSSGRGAVNAWFEEHFRAEGVGGEVGKPKAVSGKR